jgi:hypothetical protein
MSIYPYFVLGIQSGRVVSGYFFGPVALVLILSEDEKELLAEKDIPHPLR